MTKILVTGHTGFKGSWLTLMLMAQGHQVCGLALEPDPDSLFNKLDLGPHLSADHRVDLRDHETIQRIFEKERPEAVFHLAAQPLVLASYEEPYETFSINSQGTINVLHAMQKYVPDSLLISITTDKVYKNTGKAGGYVEDDELGASDPYSSSKAMADIALQSWSSSFPGSPLLSIARAGNVIGPMDHSKDRLIPDILRANKSGNPIEIRSAGATRPWQHVLDCLFGYILLLDTMKETRSSGVWNFGPLPTNEKTVEDVLTEAKKHIKFEASYSGEIATDRREHHLLTLDSSKARTELSWRDLFSFEEAIAESIEVHKALDLLSREDALEYSKRYVQSYLDRATTKSFS